MGKNKRIILLCVLASVAIVLAGVGVLVRTWIKMPEIPQPPVIENVDPNSGETVTKPVPMGDRKEGVYTFLVAGRDVASGSTDTMLLLTFDANAKTIHGLNLPRDTMVNSEDYNKRLNAVYSYNRGKDKATQVEKGMAALKQAVADHTGILPDFYVLVEWEAIGELVDALGGVEFEVPFLMQYDDIYQTPPLHIYQEPGLRLLDGDDAMQVVRWRQNNKGVGGQMGDLGRLAIQQDFLKAVVKKCLQPATLLKLDSLVEVFKNNVATDLTVGNILAFAEQAIGMNTETGVSFETAPLADSFRYDGMALVTLDPEGVLEIINTSMNPYREDIEVEDLEMLVRHSDATFTVTGGKLAESIRANMGKKPVAPTQPATEAVTEPATEPSEQEPSDPTEPGVEPGVEPEQPVEGGDPVEPVEPSPAPGEEIPEVPSEGIVVEVPEGPEAPADVVVQEASEPTT